jgi:hypothetical protein
MNFDFSKIEIINIGIIIFNLIVFFMLVANNIKLGKINKKYNIFMKKLGKGDNIEEMLHQYVNTVTEVKEKNQELIKYCNKLDKEITLCIQKVGMVRYSAFKDTGSDLSFALALLDDNNDGVLLNGIYSREMSNIYAKQIKNGEANNKLSQEEQQALEMAILKENEHRIKE